MLYVRLLGYVLSGALPKWLNDSIAMRPREQTALVHALLAPGVRTYVEWGSGGSTELVSWLMNSRLTSSEFRAYSIESSLGWMARMRERPHRRLGPPSDR